MAGLRPIRWKEFVRRLRNHGFEGPFSGGRHPYMIKGDLVLTIPNPHHGDIGIELLKRILKQAGIPPREW
jgi:predicted RNA binding protein YcfA (HicA-like mRNA interferase family)